MSIVMTEDEIRIMRKVRGAMGAAGFEAKDPRIFEIAVQFTRGDISEAEMKSLVEKVTSK